MKAALRLFLVLLAVPALALATEDHVKLDRARIDERDLVSLQRGAHTFVNYCLGCHSAGYMRYNRLTDLGLTEAQIRANLVPGDGKVGDLMKAALDPRDAKEWFGAQPPDLTVIARSRASSAGSGADWLYTYLRGFYRDPSRPNGWNNTVYPNVGMPHVLYQLQGVQALKVEEKAMPGGHKEKVQSLVLEKNGTLAPREYDLMVTDLVNYMVYMGEPARQSRVTIGIYTLMFLGVLFLLAYALKREYWKDVH